MSTFVEKRSAPFRAWVIWTLGALFMFYKYAVEVSPSVMTSTMMKTFNVSGAELGSFAAAYFYSYLLLQIPAGLLLDRFGSRNMTTSAIFACGVGALIFSQAETIFLASVGRFIAGAGGAFAAVSCLKLTAQWFPKKALAFMAGLMMTLAMLGAVGGQAPLAYLIESFTWRPAILALGLSGVALALLFFIVVKDAPKTLEVKRASLKTSLSEVLKNPQSWWLSIYSGFAFAPVMVFGGLWGVSFVKDAYHLSEELSAELVSLIFIGFAAGAPLFGWLSDRWGKRGPVMFSGTLLALVFIMTAIYLPSGSPYLLGGLLFGFGFFVSSFLVCFTMIQEQHVPWVAGTAIGFMNAFDAFVGAFSDPLNGWLLDLSWTGEMIDGVRVFSTLGYQLSFLTIPAYMLIALFALYKVEFEPAKIKETA